MDMDKLMWTIHMVEYYSAMKKEWSTDTCDNMDEPLKHDR